MNIESRSGSSGQSEVVGVILLLTLVMLGISVIAVTGLPTLDRMQENVETERLQSEFSSLDADISDVVFGGASARTVRMNTGSSSLVMDNTSGWVNVTHIPLDPANPRPLYNESLGKVEYRNNGEVIGYQGGGVWRTRVGDNGTGVVSPPEFRFQGSTLTFPIVRVNSSGQVSGSAAGDPLTVRRDEFNKVYPDPDEDNMMNPVENGTVRVTVKSRFYRGWASYFEDKANGPVSIDDENQTASVKLDVEESAGFDSGVLASGANANQLDIGNNADLASYDSSDGINNVSGVDIGSNCNMNAQDCDGHPGLYADGEIRTTGEVDVSNQGRVFGSVISTDDITVSQGEVSHDIISAEQATVDNQGDVYGDVESNADVDVEGHFTPDPVVNNEISTASSSNDNDQYNNLDNNGDDTLSNSSGSIGSGGTGDETIYLDGDVTVNDVDFELDDGNVTVAVDGNIDFMGTSSISSASGNYTLTWYVAGDVDVTQGSVHVLSTSPEMESWRNLFIVSSSGTVSISQQGRLVSTMYAPDSNLDMGNNRDIYGALIVGDFVAGNLNQLQVLYDKDLQGRSITILNPEVAITYLHVTENKVSIE